MTAHKSNRPLLKLILLTFFLVILIHSQNIKVQSKHSVSENDIITMTTDNIDSLINSQGVALVDFWAKW